ncbi:hypothetical protein [Streptomyces spectabilis]|uniref:Uncharacterized protein n=1 Tax=Streptomyces spectabilis TaxID=68270 RepID=A0A516R1S7_STRST|nr:hypothetical protein [Streptomyces spectabilis]QDQ09601.1 hypothetical protein FH965_02700 [Streptomyces spectabilis]
MSKAILGYEVSGDWMLAAEARRLQKRVRDLESRLVHLEAEKKTLAAQIRESELIAAANAAAELPAAELPLGDPTRELSADVRALTELVAHLMAKMSLVEADHAGAPLDNVATAPVPSAVPVNDFEGGEIVALSEYAEEREMTSPGWQRVTSFLAIGALLDLGGRASAEALERSYNRARGMEIEFIETDLPEASTAENAHEREGGR